MKDWLPSNDSPVTGGLFYPLVVLESSSHLLPSFSDHLAYMKAVDLKCQNFHHSFQKGQNFWWGSKTEKYVLSTTGTVSQRTHHIVWFSEDGKRYTKLCKHFFSGILIPKLPPSMQLDLHINKKDAKATCAKDPSWPNWLIVTCKSNKEEELIPRCGMWIADDSLEEQWLDPVVSNHFQTPKIYCPWQLPEMDVQLLQPSYELKTGAIY
jgi:hypothetical protein